MARCAVAHGAPRPNWRCTCAPTSAVPMCTRSSTRIPPWPPHWASHDAFLMAHHGALTVGRSLRDAHQRMESLEHGTRIMWTARALADLPTLPVDALAVLDAQRRAARGA